MFQNNDAHAHEATCKVKKKLSKRCGICDCLIILLWKTAFNNTVALKLLIQPY